MLNACRVCRRATLFASHLFNQFYASVTHSNLRSSAREQANKTLKNASSDFKDDLVHFQTGQKTAARHKLALNADIDLKKARILELDKAGPCA